MTRDKELREKISKILAFNNQDDTNEYYLYHSADVPAILDQLVELVNSEVEKRDEEESDRIIKESLRES